MTDLRPLFPRTDDAELRARLRSLQALARVLCGTRAAALARTLADAERDPGAIPAALDLLERLSQLDRRRVLATWAKLLRRAG